MNVCTYPGDSSASIPSNSSVPAARPQQFKCPRKVQNSPSPGWIRINCIHDRFRPPDQQLADHLCIQTIPVPLHDSPLQKQCCCPGCKSCCHTRATPAGKQRPDTASTGKCTIYLYRRSRKLRLDTPFSCISAARFLIHRIIPVIIPCNRDRATCICRCT